jgi:predicted Fe-S protein YdhL (DUF1289 family)
MTIESPCNKTCTMHPVSGLCIGCGRTLDEIARWGAMSPRERAEILTQLPARLAARPDMRVA